MVLGPVKIVPNDDYRLMYYYETDPYNFLTVSYRFHCSIIFCALKVDFPQFIHIFIPGAST